ncbi:hypothetical protein [Diaphorobacter aerolatus]|uniref:Uncharacterized protein n=1 Tax=Diaphorobacter aerolatus TaxID=1288495 RepID=A0A7H0GMH4_9BURK|nr:hypothetical protein [Diaphorobacter aerolatus]QNP49490.1 hypothetical protein H9K75_05655 [Diaphorobacter aerolatus]
MPTGGTRQAKELFAFDPAGNLLDDHVSSPKTLPEQPGLSVVGDNRLRFYQDLHFEYGKKS